MHQSIKRCQCRNVNNNRICLNKTKNLYMIENKKYCLLHFNYCREKYAKIIQKYYRGYRKRCLLKNIYKKLPEDLQSIIIKHVRKDYYYHNSLKKILKNKFLEFHKLIYNLYYNDYSTNYYQYNDNPIDLRFNLIRYIFSETKQFIKIGELYKKYNLIIKNKKEIVDKIKESHKLIKIKLYQYENSIYNANSSHIFDVCYAAFLKFDYNINPNTSLSSVS